MVTNLKCALFTVGALVLGAAITSYRLTGDVRAGLVPRYTRKVRADLNVVHAQQANTARRIAAANYAFTKRQVAASDSGASVAYVLDRYGNVIGVAEQPGRLQSAIGGVVIPQNSPAYSQPSMVQSPSVQIVIVDDTTTTTTTQTTIPA